MQINEVFKTIDGRIRLIDNIGLMGEGTKTSGVSESVDGTSAARVSTVIVAAISF